MENCNLKFLTILPHAVVHSPHHLMQWKLKKIILSPYPPPLFLVSTRWSASNWNIPIHACHLICPRSVRIMQVVAVYVVCPMKMTQNITVYSSSYCNDSKNDSIVPLSYKNNARYGRYSLSYEHQARYHTM